MTTFVLVHGSYQGGWIWQRVVTRLRSAGHTVYAPTMDGCAERRHALRPGIDTSTYVAEIADLLFYDDLRDAGRHQFGRHGGLRRCGEDAATGRAIGIGGCAGIVQRRTHA
jgi:hypothetical protein